MHEAGEIEGIGIVADTFKEAKKMSHYELGIEWIDIRGNLKKGVDASDFSSGIIDPEQGLELGVYDYVEGMECPKCNTEGVVVHSTERGPRCMDCREQPEQRSNGHNEVK